MIIFFLFENSWCLVPIIIVIFKNVEGYETVKIPYIRTGMSESPT